MLTVEPTSEMIAEWKRIYEVYRSKLTANRKSGFEVDNYFRGKYSYCDYDNERFRKIATMNITQNEYSAKKLQKGKLPNIKSYKTGNVLVAIDLCSGEFHMESENIDEVIPIYDDLFVYRGLDEDDVNNFFLVAEYVKLTQKKVN